jgi:hypothetical protein
MGSGLGRGCVQKKERKMVRAVENGAAWGGGGNAKQETRDDVVGERGVKKRRG